jgi:hypothetical protein
MISSFCLSLVMVIGLITIVASGGGGGGGGGTDTPVDNTIDPNNIVPSSITTFDDEGGDICLEDGKPVIRMYSSSTCPYCAWDANAFDPVAKMYVEDGLIVAHHWEIWDLYNRTGDDLLTDEVEGTIPESEIDIFGMFNPDYSTPTFVFGCKYTREGASRYNYGLEAEAAEFMAVIEELLDLTTPAP